MGTSVSELEFYPDGSASTIVVQGPGQGTSGRSTYRVLDATRLEFATGGHKQVVSVVRNGDRMQWHNPQGFVVELERLQQQGSVETVTTADILELSRAGLGDDVIIGKIKSSRCECDTSIDGIKQLKQAGVSDRVIVVLLESKAKATPTPVAQPAAYQPQPASEPVPGLPSESGAYYRKGDSWIPLQQAPSETKATGFVSVKVKRVYRGREAPVQIQECEPKFFIRTYGYTGIEREWLIVRLKQKEKERELQVARASMFSVGTGYPETDTVKLRVNRVASDIYEVVPEKHLTTGEYVLVAIWLSHDFGIRCSSP